MKWGRIPSGTFPWKWLQSGGLRAGRGVSQWPNTRRSKRVTPTREHNLVIDLNGDAMALLGDQWRSGDLPEGWKKTVRTLGEVSVFFAVSRHTVSDWRKAGMPGSKGSFQLHEIAVWKRSRKQDPEVVAEQEANHRFKLGTDEDWLEMRRSGEARKKLADAEMAELRNKIREGKLIDRDAIEPAIAEAVNGAKLLFGKVPEEMMPMFPTEQRVDLAQELERRLDAVLIRLSDWLTSNVEDAFKEQEGEG